MRTKMIAYWASTTIIALELLAGGTTDLVRGPALLIAGPPVVNALAQLGYPMYFLTILGFWKVLGAVAMLAPRSPRLKEWAYAGAVFEMTGASASWAICSGKASDIIPPFIFALLAIASWALRPQSRTLGILIPAKPHA